jgi:hypothetical protein
MLTKKVGSKLEITSKEQSKVYGGTCGQTCHDSCPTNDWTRFGSYSGIYNGWRLTPWPFEPI